MLIIKLRSNKMKIFAVNGSPKKDKGNTEKILRPFLEGARDGGAQVEVVYVAGMDIKPCLGCNACWLKTPGKCVQKDDMDGLVESLRESEVMVLASPIYVGGVTGQMKIFLDRMIPVSPPFIEVKDGKSAHSVPEGSNFKGVVFVSNNGFHELYHFDDMIAHCRSIATMLQAEFLGSLVRPHGVLLDLFANTAPDKVKAVYDAAKQAGKELAQHGTISKTLQDQVAQELMPRDKFNEVMNDFFTKAWEAAQKKTKKV